MVFCAARYSDMVLSRLLASASSARAPDGVPNPTIKASAAAHMLATENVINFRAIFLI
jgi:hypothetical protein